jgi:HlyD family secretion protein
MSWPRRVVAALFVLAIAGLGAVSLKPKAEPPVAVQAVAARQGAITRVVTGGGKLQAATEVKLSSNITGDLVDLAIREGDTVARGQVLGHIDARRYGAQLSQAEGARNGAAADLQGARVRAAALEAEYKRVATLAAGQNASGAELEKARAELDAARATAAHGETCVPGSVVDRVAAVATTARAARPSGCIDAIAACATVRPVAGSAAA